ncbi:MAG: hypothetical protein V2B15_08675 [Bacteroidota bacterium]
MVKNSSVPEEPAKADRHVIPTGQADYIPGKPYSKLKREIGEEDLAHPAVQRLLLNEIDKLEQKNEDLNSLREKYYILDKENAVLKQSLKSIGANEVLYGICLTIGSILIGLSGQFKETGYTWVLILVGGLLIGAGIISKFVKWI